MNVDQKNDCEDPFYETTRQWEPPMAPLAMPRQVLEQPTGKSLIEQLAMLIFPREPV
ncbi:hypothetical protein [Pseudorhodobacter aquimaris]|uniref:hypothetical protein n=1 Tax=Pseudorhodobacter aquimaris TaxID=687412 RepID=UPI000A6E844F|nr:hypothetical protein [Pseudorhodobacter aquimaris]